MEALDVDRDGVIGRNDLIDALWHLGVILPIEEFEKLLENVQLDASCIEHVQESVLNPNLLQKFQKDAKEDYLKGTLPQIKWLSLRFLTFLFGVPIL